MENILTQDDVLAVAGEMADRNEVLAEMAREDEQEQGWAMLGVEPRW
jgi:hypothetical protein